MSSLKLVLSTILFLSLLSSPASAYSEQSTMLSSQGWAQYVAQNPVALGVYSVAGIPSCVGDDSAQLFIDNSDGQITTKCTCTLNYINIEFLAPTGFWVYQYRQQDNSWNIIQQKATAQTVDGQYNKVLANPETLGVFSFRQELKTNQVQQLKSTMKNVSVSKVKAQVKQSTYNAVYEFKKRLERTIQKLKDGINLWKKRLK